MVYNVCMQPGICRHMEGRDYSHLHSQENEWTRTVYGEVKEEIPKNIPKPLGKRVITTTYLDAKFTT